MTPYIISYFAAGLLVAISGWLNDAFAGGKRPVGVLTTIFLWPLVVLAAPEFFFSKSKTASGDPDSVTSPLRALLARPENLPLSQEEAHRLMKVTELGESGVAYFGYFHGCEEALRSFWDSSIPPSVYHEVESARRALQEPEQYTDVLFSLKVPDWYIGFSNEFLKSISKIDRTSRARVLEAIRKIGDAPMTVLGDTIKPLTGDLAGLWRYRLGNDRLIYFPHADSRRVTLICYGPRSKIYQKVPDTATLTSQ